ncbi:RNA 2',3'-cyclic phosphodiesterase [Patescibacteria group bacterium]
MQRKIFIGIDLPGKVKKRLMQKIEKYQDLPVRWSAEENLHITLVFLGHVDDDLLPEVCENVQRAVGDVDIFDIDFNRIELGPGPGAEAKMVWVSGEASEELKDLQEKIEKELGVFGREKKAFRPHITLGRIKQFGWSELDEFPEINEEYLLGIPVENVDIIESTVIDGKRKFMVIESCPMNY